MEFIDKEGHVFSCGSSSAPTGWREAQPDYIFWAESPVTGPDLSVSEYYVNQIIPYISATNTLKPDGGAVQLSAITSVTVTCESNVFKLKGCAAGSPSGITFDMGSEEMSSYITTVSYNRDSLIISDDDIICPFFTICMSESAGELLANALIEIKYSDNGGTSSSYTVIRFGGVFRETSEKLLINAANNGADIKPAVMGGVYQAPPEFDAALYNAKLREYMMNKPELTAGGYSAMLKAAKWFGWGGMLVARRLLRTDNKRAEQYARDCFGKTDRQAGEKSFKESGAVSFRAKENARLFKGINSAGDEAAVSAPADWEADFSGESLPEAEDLFDKYINAGGAPIERYEPYYMWDRAVIMAKLALFKYYYRKYFCPAATSVRAVSLELSHTAQDIKSLHYSAQSVCEAPVLCAGRCVVDIFGDSRYDIYDISPIIKTVRFESAIHYMDRDFCEFSNYADESLHNSIGEYDASAPHQIYESHEMCAVVPLRFYSSMEEKLDGAGIDSSYIYDTQIILSRGGTEVWSCTKRFCQSNDSVFNNIIIIPKLMPGVKDIGWEGAWHIDVCCNGRWFAHDFNVAAPEPYVEIGYIEYAYDDAFAEKAVMWDARLVSVTNSDYISDIMAFSQAKNDGGQHVIDALVKKYTDTFTLPSYDTAPQYYNIILYIDLNDNSGAPVDEEKANKILNSVKTVCGDIAGCAYDAHLMRDEQYAAAHNGDNRYYIVLISKYTINEMSAQAGIAPMQIKSAVTEYVSKTGTALETAVSQYAFYDARACAGSVTCRFLINRMRFVACDNGAIPADKIICCSIYKNNAFSDNPATLEESFYANSGNLPFRMDVMSSKWRFIPYSVSISGVKACSSKANTAIMSLPGTSNEYMRGYYNVEVEYSIDGRSAKTYRLPYKIRVK